MAINLNIREIFPHSPVLDRLETFVGEWVVNGNVAIYGSPVIINGTWSAVRVSAGCGLRANMKIDFENIGIYEQEDLIGYNPDTSNFQVFGVTNIGSPHLFEGSLNNNDEIVLKRQGTQYGSEFTDNLKILSLNSNYFEISESHHVNGKQVLSANLSLTRSR